MFELGILLFALVVLIVASYNDLRTREVPDYLSYFIIALGLAFRMIWFLYDGDVRIVSWIPVSFSVLFVFSYLMYRAGQWGGGDVKVMMGMSILLSWFPNYGKIPFFVDFFLNSLIVGAFYGVFMIFLKGAMNFEKIKKYFSYLDYIFLPSLLMGIVLLFVFTNMALAIILTLITMSIGMIRYFKVIENVLMREKIDVGKLTEGDWLLQDVKINGKVFVKRRDIGLIKEDIKKLRTAMAKGKIGKVLIRVGVPFVPSFLFSLVTTVLVGNVLLKMVYLGMGFI